MKLPDPDYVTKQERQALCLSASFTMDTRHKIPALWEDFWSRDWDADTAIDGAPLGISHCVSADGSFKYACGIEVEAPPEPMPDGACMVTLSGGTYAVFRARGPISTLPQMFDAIFSQWLPGSGRTQREGAVYERYPRDEANTPEEMAYEIWVPVAA